MANLKPFFNAGVIEAGCDEAGRGCLAGPVYAAAVILPENFYHPLLNDSKQLTKKQRDELRPIIMKEAVAYGIASVSPKEIDKINILNASIKAMHKALEKLKTQPESIIVDGNKFKPYKKIQHKCIVKGDATYASIAAASILAKTSRDAYMLKIAKEFPQYGWDKNMAYPTKEHRAAIEKYGATKYHRMTYQLLPELKLF
jgi:ribonuclease HII